VAADHALGLLYCLGVVSANQRLETKEVFVTVHGIAARGLRLCGGRGGQRQGCSQNDLLNSIPCPRRRTCPPLD
jgi:hypothetical protein